MTKTLIDVDPDLLRQAKDLLSTDTNKATLHAGLVEVVALHARRALLVDAADGAFASANDRHTAPSVGVVVGVTGEALLLAARKLRLVSRTARAPARGGSLRRRSDCVSLDALPQRQGGGQIGRRKYGPADSQSDDGDASVPVDDHEPTAQSQDRSQSGQEEALPRRLSQVPVRRPRAEASAGASPVTGGPTMHSRARSQMRTCWAQSAVAGRARLCRPERRRAALRRS